MPVTRPPSPTDAPAIAALLGQLGYPTSSGDVWRRLSNLGGNGVAVVVVDDSGKVAGVASATCYHTLHADGKTAYITALVTDVTARGQGVGRALVDAITRWALEQGCAKLAVTSAEHRADAHEFYP